MYLSTLCLYVSVVMTPLMTHVGLVAVPREREVGAVAVVVHLRHLAMPRAAAEYLLLLCLPLLHFLLGVWSSQADPPQWHRDR